MISVPTRWSLGRLSLPSSPVLPPLLPPQAA